MTKQIVEEFSINCPKCKVNVHVPFVRELEARAIEEADLAEITARQQLDDVRYWLNSASLWELVKFWSKRSK